MSPSSMPPPRPDAMQIVREVIARPDHHEASTLLAACATLEVFGDWIDALRARELRRVLRKAPAAVGAPARPRSRGIATGALAGLLRTLRWLPSRRPIGGGQPLAGTSIPSRPPATGSIVCPRPAGPTASFPARISP